MLIKRIVISLFLLMFVPVLAAAEGRYYLNEKIRGYKEAEFVLLTGDDVNFRKAPVDGQVIKCLPHHTLMRVLERQGDWLKVDISGTEGYISGAFVGSGERDYLTSEDFTGAMTNLGVNFDEDKATAELGKPQKEYRDKETKRDIYDYGKVLLGIRHHKVESIEIRDPQFITMRGVSIGDSNGRAIGQYGMPDGVVYADDCTEYEYRFDSELPSRFVIGIDDNNVITKFVMESLDD